MKKRVLELLASVLFGFLRGLIYLKLDRAYCFMMAYLVRRMLKILGYRGK